MIFFENILNFLNEAKNVEQTSSYHLENLYVHTLRVSDYLYNKTNSKVLVLAGLLHDTGKIETAKQINGRWTFHGHALVSAIKLSDFISKDDVLYKDVYDLVYCHMLPYETLGSTKAINKFLSVNKYPLSFYSNILLFNSADENGCVRDSSLLKPNEYYEPTLTKLLNFLKN